ncbi:MAG: esterase [Anaerolineae bacterium]|nr:esterase [Anaerolineae bacterium]
MPDLQTVLGPVDGERLGLILAHEHLCTDLRTPDQPGQGEADPDDVVRVMGPYLDEASDAGVSALIECTPPGVGQNAAAIEALARASSVALIMPTGLYRQQWIPAQALAMSDAQLTAWMIAELTEGIQGTRVRAGFIKMGVSNEAITPDEARNLRAAARAARETGVLVASHTSGPLSGQHALEQLDILASQGLPGEQFNWVHAQHADVSYHAQAARRGAYIGFDNLKPEEEDRYVRLVLDAIEAGLAERILLSHDNGWYRPGEPDGGASQVRGFTYLVRGFLPRLRGEGIGEDLIALMTHANPVRAFCVRPS